MKVKLDHKEVVMAATMGVLRHEENVRIGRRDAHGASPTDGWRLHIEGALGEYAVAKALGLFPSGLAEFAAVDILGAAFQRTPYVQVRTAAGSRRRLIVHRDDPDEHAFVLVTGMNGTYDVRGWLLGREAKQSEWWGDPSGEGRWAYFAPQNALHPIEELIENGVRASTH